MREIGVIFDLDGVIVDTAKYHYLAWKKLADKFGFEFTLEHNELLKGVSRKASLEVLLKIGNIIISDAEKEKILVEKNTNYLALINDMTTKEILPGVLNLLSFLEKNNIKYALGSASKNAPFILKRIGLYNKFSAIVDGNHVSKAKPDPEVFLIAASRLQVKPHRCIVFEDAIAGIEAANAADMISIGVGDGEVLKNANYTVNDLTELESSYMERLLSEVNNLGASPRGIR